MIGRCAISGRRQRVRPLAPYRWYASTRSKPKKDLPPPLPPKASSSTSTSSSTSQTTNVSPAQAKKDYLEARKKTGEFLKDPQANIARLQAEMQRSKEDLLKVHDKPVWRRIVDRFKAKQHAVINLLAASMAYILAHRLHLKMKDNEELKQDVDLERTKNSELRSLLLSLQTEDFAGDVVAQATNATNSKSSTQSSAKGSSWWFLPTKQGSSKQQGSTSSSLPQNDALTTSLRQALAAKIGDEGLEDADRKKKSIRAIWKENEQRIENSNSSSDEGLVELTRSIAAAEDGSGSKKRVFDM